MGGALVMARSFRQMGAINPSWTLSYFCPTFPIVVCHVFAWVCVCLSRLPAQPHFGRGKFGAEHRLLVADAAMSGRYQVAPFDCGRGELASCANRIRFQQKRKGLHDSERP